MPRRRALLAGGLSLAAIGPAGAQPSGAWLDTLMQRLSEIPSRRADFTEQKRIAALAQPLASRGRLIYVRPAQLEKITDAPRAERLIVDGDRLSLSTGGGAARVLSLAASPLVAALVEGVRATLAGDLAGLRRLYVIAAVGGLAGWRLILTPARPPLTRVLRSVTINGAGTDIRAIAVEQTNGDRQLMTITPSS
ncbi:MAG TPA: outer membrane lipoprotein carrier protein LolA [Acetobacteraceae bacterium]|nr:outer membrane lipoprotein carrier protein LolA [Acetobacteraceae bacterium]